MLVSERAEIRSEQSHGSRAADREKQQREEAQMLYSSMENSGPGLVERCENPLIFERCLELLKLLKVFIKMRGFEPSCDYGDYVNTFRRKENFSV
jgi:hypothetical protein